ncbi:hypothetical protein [Alkalihalobacillus sp. LMS39]|uniref:hypothetical protein n=1 Tax=Alkalihalobacillus sp. LMS39 TaxID=2924032 RepID=UPI001FB454CE|nr:hypothetical protein [Alkalihalobacillus sp. LMS39]UOE94309.1 hypothetical protein MM271_01070 [Alkalihalobacillus sp. LMS39]
MIDYLIGVFFAIVILIFMPIFLSWHIVQELRSKRNKKRQVKWRKKRRTTNFKENMRATLVFLGSVIIALTVGVYICLPFLHDLPHLLNKEEFTVTGEVQKVERGSKGLYRLTIEDQQCERFFLTHTVRKLQTGDIVTATCMPNSHVLLKIEER